MRRLTLLRHAKSSWDDPELDDFDRPLSPRGLRAVPEMGRRLARRDDRPALVVSSPAQRAIATARGVAREIGLGRDRVTEEPRLYLASTAEILDVVRGLDDRDGHVMIVGHNPGFTDLANRLGEIRIDNMPTAAMLCVDFPQARWAEVGPRDAAFVYFDCPKRPG